MVSLEGNNLGAYYTLSTFDICPEKKGRFWWEVSYKMGTAVILEGKGVRVLGIC